jgi:hypothetical protein
VEPDSTDPRSARLDTAGPDDPATGTVSGRAGTRAGPDLTLALGEQCADVSDPAAAKYSYPEGEAVRPNGSRIASRTAFSGMCDRAVTLSASSPR